MISAEITTKAQFYDLDPMQVVWHGNYTRFLEEARCALLDHIGYNYQQMADSGFIWPIVELKVKYVRPIRFAQVIRVSAVIVEYENRLRIDYRIMDAESGEVLTKAQTTQVAVNVQSQELCLESPIVMVEKIRRCA